MPETWFVCIRDIRSRIAVGSVGVIKIVTVYPAAVRTGSMSGISAMMSVWLATESRIPICRLFFPLPSDI
jgi:hypothetical protein